MPESVSVPVVKPGEKIEFYGVEGGFTWLIWSPAGVRTGMAETMEIAAIRMTAALVELRTLPALQSFRNGRGGDHYPRP